MYEPPLRRDRVFDVGKAFDSPALQKLTLPQKAQYLNALYEDWSSGSLQDAGISNLPNSAVRRHFRSDSLDYLQKEYAKEVQANPKADYSGMRSMLKEWQDRDVSDWVGDFKRAMSGDENASILSKAGMGALKGVWDLVRFGHALAGGIGEVLTPTNPAVYEVAGIEPVEKKDFFKAYAEANKSSEAWQLSQWFKQYHDRVFADDPEMGDEINLAISNLAFAAVFGFGAARAAAKAGAGLLSGAPEITATIGKVSFQAPGAPSMARAYAGSLAANFLQGEIVAKGVTELGDLLVAGGVEQDTALGISALLMLAGGPLTHKPTRLAEAFFRGDFGKMEEFAKRAKAAMAKANLRETLLNDPNVSDVTKDILSGKTEKVTPNFGVTPEPEQKPVGTPATDREVQDVLNREPTKPRLGNKLAAKAMEARKQKAQQARKNEAAAETLTGKTPLQEEEPVSGAEEVRTAEEAFRESDEIPVEDEPEVLGEEREPVSEPEPKPKPWQKYGNARKAETQGGQPVVRHENKDKSTFRVWRYDAEGYRLDMDEPVEFTYNGQNYHSVREAFEADIELAGGRDARSSEANQKALTRIYHAAVSQNPELIKVLLDSEGRKIVGNSKQKGWYPKAIAKSLEQVRKELKTVADATDPYPEIQKLNDRRDALSNQIATIEANIALEGRVPTPEELEQLRTLRDKLTATNVAIAKSIDELPEPKKATTIDEAFSMLEALPDEEKAKVNSLCNACAIAAKTNTDVSGASLITKSFKEIFNKTLMKLINEPKLYSNNPFENRGDLVSNTAYGPMTNLGYILEKYPLAGAYLRTRIPLAESSGLISAHQLNNAVVSITRALGPLADEKVYQSARPVIEQLNLLWDDFRDNIPAKGGTLLADYLDSRGDLTPAQVKLITEQMHDILDGLEVAYTVDPTVLDDGALAQASPFFRTITLKEKNIPIGTLVHELAHINLYWGLTAEERMAFFDGARKQCTSLEQYLTAFPDAAKYGDSTTYTARELSWLNDPGELYAELMKTYFFSNVMPDVQTLRGFQRAKGVLQRLLGVTTHEVNWEQVPQDMKNLLIRLVHGPDPVNAKEVPMSIVEDNIQRNRMLLNQQDGVTLATAVLAQPVEAMLSSVEGTVKFLQGHIMGILYDVPGASFEQAKTAVQRLSNMFEPEKVLDFLDRTAPTKGMEKFGPNDRLAITEENARRLYSLSDEELAATAKDMSDPRLAAHAKMVQTEKLSQELVNLLNNVLVRKGLVEAIDPQYLHQLQFAGVLAQSLYPLINEGKRFWSGLHDGSAWAKMAVRAAWAGYCGLEEDPNGWEMPFGWGTYSWSPTRLFKNPASLLLAPMLPEMGKSLLRIGKGYKLDTIARLKLRKLRDNFPRFDKACYNLDMTRKWVTGYDTPLAEAVAESKYSGQRAARDFSILAETLFFKYQDAPELLDVMALAYEKTTGWEGAWNKLPAELQAQLQADMRVIDEMYQHIPEYFMDTDVLPEGVKSSPFGAIKEGYINRTYEWAVNKMNTAIYMDASVSPIRANYLADRGVDGKISNTMLIQDKKGRRRKGLAYNNAKNSKTNFENDLAEMQVPANKIVGLKINEWLVGNGIEYTIPGSTRDIQFMTDPTVLEWHVWDKNSGTEGAIIHGIDKDNNYLTTRQLTKKEREEMHEIVNPVVRAAHMADMLQTDIRRAKMYKALADNTSWSKDISDMTSAEIDELVAKHWVQIPDEINAKTGLKKWGALNGRLVHPDAWQAMKSVEPGLFTRAWFRERNNPDVISSLARGWLGLVNHFKKVKTIYSYKSHLNNFLSNVAMGYIQGHDVFGEMAKGRHLMQLHDMSRKAVQLRRHGNIQEAQAVEAQMKQHPMWEMYQEIQDTRLGASTFYRSEFTPTDFFNKIENAKAGGATDSDILTRLGSFISEKEGQLQDWAGFWYEKGDLLFKFGAYALGREKGMPPEIALKWALDAYLDYSNLSRGAEFLKHTGLVPFVSYSYRAIPGILKAFRDHPERVALVSLLLEGVHNANIMAQFGVNPMRAKAISNELDDELMPDYMRKNRSTGGAFRNRIAWGAGLGPTTPSKRGDSIRMNFVDLTNKLPSTGMLDTDGRGVDIFSPGEYLRTLVTENPYINAAVWAATGKNLNNPFQSTFGAEVEVDEVKGRPWKGIGESIFQSLIPNMAMMPGSYDFQKVVGALEGRLDDPAYKGWFTESSGLDNTGLPIRLGSLAGSLLGFNNRDVAIDYANQMALRSLRFGATKERSSLGSYLRRPQIDAEHKREAIDSSKRVLEQIKEKGQSKAQSLQRLRDLIRQRGQGATSLPSGG